MIVTLVLILINGLFSMSEIAVVSARKSRLQALAEGGNSNAAQALKLAEKPETFLATVQIGITLVAILMGAFGTVQIAAQLQRLLDFIPALAAYAPQIAQVTAVILLTYLTLLLGELAPKQIGLTNSTTIASAIAPFMNGLAWLTRPFVRLLEGSTRLLLTALRIKPSSEPTITEDEIQVMLEMGTVEGIVEPIEEEIVEKLFQVGDLHVNDLMIDRTDIIWFDVGDTLETIAEKVRTTKHSRYPVARGRLDQLIGLVFIEDILIHLLDNKMPNLELLAKPAQIIPTGLPAFDVLERFKEEKSQIAIVIDEHGGVEGLVTFIDLLEAIVGDVPERSDPANPLTVQRQDGSWLIDGKLSVAAFKHMFDLEELPNEDDNFYQTMGGFAMNQLGRVPGVGDRFEWEGHTIEVVDMDWRRVDQILVIPPVKDEERDEGDAPDS